MSKLDLSKLNKEQLSAVIHTEGKVLVLAGAGSGKTRVLTHRIAHLVLDKGVFPSTILAITFTNKATEEMRERLKIMTGEDCNVFVSTYHSFCCTVLRKNAELLGYKNGFSIYDDSDKNRILKKIAEKMALENERDIQNYSSRINEAKNKGFMPDEAKSELNFADDEYRFYKLYQDSLMISNAMDFDDLLLQTLRLFKNHKDCLKIYQTRFRYIHVDEFQDTNEVQFEIVKLLSELWGNLFVVGDDDQSIYGWRGAKVENIINFDKIFENVTVFKLLQNYRSTNRILKAANQVIKNNVKRHEKELYSQNGEGVKVEYYHGFGDHQEAEYVVNQMKILKNAYGYSNKDFAVLVRINSLSRLFESKLAQSNLTYRVLGGFKFFDRKEILDVIAYLRIILNPSDSSAVERVINFPKRGIGDTTVETLSSMASDRSVSLLDAIINSSDKLSSSSSKKIEIFKNLVLELQTKKDLPLDKLVEFVIEKVDFEGYYSQSNKEEDEVRLDNIKEFARYAKEFVRNNTNATLEDFLQTVSLAPENKDVVEDKNRVTIATMHAVKGLEFKVVFVCGCEEDIFPSARCKDDLDMLEEERRIMYVAVTRAMERLYITCASSRFRFNKVINTMPSRFITESKGEQLFKSGETYSIYQSKRQELDRKYGKYNDERDTSSSPKHTYVPPVNIVKPNVVQNVSADIAKFTVGASINHPKYGVGKIIMINGNGSFATATIEFPNLGVKKFTLNSAPLELLK